jgi:hypothetical protein
VHIYFFSPNENDPQLGAGQNKTRYRLAVAKPPGSECPCSQAIAPLHEQFALTKMRRELYRAARQLSTKSRKRMRGAFASGN